MAVKIAKKQRGKGRPFIKNDPRINKEGRPQGSRNFTTLMDEMVREIAVERKISEAEVWGILIKKGYTEAEKGNYLYFRDILDRYYGKAKDNLDLTTGGEKINTFDDKQIGKIARRILNGDSTSEK